MRADRCQHKAFLSNSTACTNIAEGSLAFRKVVGGASSVPLSWVRLIKHGPFAGGCSSTLFLRSLLIFNFFFLSFSFSHPRPTSQLCSFILFLGRPRPIGDALRSSGFDSPWNFGAAQWNERLRFLKYEDSGVCDPEIRWIAMYAL